MICHAEKLGDSGDTEKRVDALGEQHIGVGICLGEVFPAVFRRQYELDYISKKC